MIHKETKETRKQKILKILPRRRDRRHRSAPVLGSSKGLTLRGRPNVPTPPALSTLLRPRTGALRFVVYPAVSLIFDRLAPFRKQIGHQVIKILRWNDFAEILGHQ